MSFDEWKNKTLAKGEQKTWVEWCGEAYEAGAASRQAEIDALQKKYDAMYRAFTVADDARQEWNRCYVGVRQREDELQKRIDDALKEFEDNNDPWSMIVEEVIKILKGEKEVS